MACLVSCISLSSEKSAFFDNLQKVTLLSTLLHGFANNYGLSRILLQLQGIEIPHNPGYHGIDISEFPVAEEITIEMIIEDVSYTKKVRL